MPKKGGKSKKRSEQYTPRDDENNNDSRDVKEEKNEETQPSEAIVPAEVVQDETVPEIEEPAEENKIDEEPAAQQEEPEEPEVPERQIIEEPEVVPEPPAKQEELAHVGESSGFVVVKEQTTEIKSAPVEIKSAPAAEIGIRGMKRDIHPEIQSPFRRKKTEGGLKLSLLQEPDSPISEDPKEDEDHRFDQIKPQWDQVLANLHCGQKYFEDLKQASREEHIRMYREGEFNTLVQHQSESLELKLPEGINVDHETLTQFYAHVKETMSQITDFIHILQDWVDTKKHQLEEEVPADQLKKPIIKEEVIEEEPEDDQHILDAERMGISSNNHEELKGLVREASIRVEKGEPALVKTQSTKKSKSENKIEEDENKEEESNGDSYMPKVVIAAALVVAAGSIYFKYYLKK